MDYIDKLLKTEEGTKTLKGHLKSVPKYEKEKPQFQKLWKRVCEALNQHHLIKQKKLSKQKALEEHKKLIAVTKNSKPKYLLQASKFKKKAHNSTLMLEKLYPNTFDYDHPKPLKINILQDLKENIEIKDKLLNNTLAYYTRSPQYHYSFIENSHRYDLSGNAVAELTEEEKSWAISSLYKAIGRLQLKKDYPTLADQVLNDDITKVPPVVVQADYGNHYYAEILLNEISAILRDCYGKSFCLLERATHIDKKFLSVIQVMRHNELLFETEAEGKSIKKAQHLALSRLLSKLQSTINAYPFEYEK